MKRIYAILALIFGLGIAMEAAHYAHSQAGGFPSFPTFQGVAVGGTCGAPAQNNLCASGTLNALNYQQSGVATVQSFAATATSTLNYTSNAVCTADAALTLTLASGHEYLIDGMIAYSNSGGAAGGGLRTCFSYSGTGGAYYCAEGFNFQGGTGAWGGSVNSISASATFANTTFQNGPFAADITGGVSWFRCVMIGGSVGGTLQVGEAQSVSNATATVRQIGSYVRSTLLQ